jgi:ATP-dependent DNA helicase RecG
LIQKPEADARAVLERLVEFGLVEPRGERKGRAYHLSAATYRRLGEKAAYVRVRGFDALQQEQMVLQYVRANGRITRADAAALCRISPYQATRLLRRLVDAHSIGRHGMGRGTWYAPRT